MFRLLFVLLALTPSFLPAQPPAASHADVLAMIERLETDPMHADARHEMEVLFNWLDVTDEAVVMISNEDMNRIFERRVPYNRHLYILLLSGMARYDLLHPESDIEDPNLDTAEGFVCMCNGYKNLLEKHGVKPDKYFKKLCKEHGVGIE